jgi:hypothetical protein
LITKNATEGKDYPLEEAFAMIDKGVAKLKEEKAA